MSHPEGECSDGGYLREDLRGGLSPEVQSRFVDLALRAAREAALREHSLWMRRDCFKAFSPIEEFGDRSDFDLAEQ